MNAHKNCRKIIEYPLAAKELTRPPGHYFFGYYDKLQFDESGSRVLGLRCDFEGRLQRPDDEAIIGLIDVENCGWEPLARTGAWNWQMGCMLQWIPGREDTIIYNSRDGGRFVSVVLEISSGREKVLPLPVFALHPGGKIALTLDFARLWIMRPETGYCGGTAKELPPEKDGITRMDLETGETRLLISFPDIPEYKIYGPGRSYFTHILFNPSGTRFMFWFRGGAGARESAVYTADADGGNIFKVADNNSHCAWCGDDKILAWANPGMVLEKSAHLLFRDGKEGFEIIGAETLRQNGHFSFSPGGRWMLADSCPDDDNRRDLMLFDFLKQECYRMGNFSSPAGLKGPLRCDLHPRWDRKGLRVCFDSTHESVRQMYLVDASPLVTARDSL